MGVGVYRSDFGGMGVSINVHGPLGTDEDYKAYVAANQMDGEDPVSRETWSQDEYDEFNENLLSIVEGVAKSVGIPSLRSGKYDGQSVDFDRKMTGIASGDVFEVGWCSWQHDFVIAVGPSVGFAELLEDSPDGDLRAIIDKGRAPARLRDDYHDVLADFKTLLRIVLAEGGIETAFPTSGYTSSTYTVTPEEAASAEELRAKVEAGIDRLSAEADFTVHKQDPDERIALAKAILARTDWNGEYGPSVLVACYDTEGRCAGLWDPADETDSLAASMSTPHELVDFFEALPTEQGLAAIPYCPETVEFYASCQGIHREFRVVVSPEQYSAATGLPCEISWTDLPGDTQGRAVLHDPAAAPAIKP